MVYFGARSVKHSLYRFMTPILEIKKLRPDAKLPVRASEFSSCLDIHAIDAGTIVPGRHTLVKTGLSMSVPAGYEIQVRSRSGLANKAGIFVLNSPGTVDADFRGEIGVILMNLGSDEFRFNAGDRIAQIAVCPVELWEPVEVSSLSETKRGGKGFGSSGV